MLGILKIGPQKMLKWSSSPCRTIRGGSTEKKVISPQPFLFLNHTTTSILYRNTLHLNKLIKKKLSGVSTAYLNKLFFHLWRRPSSIDYIGDRTIHFKFSFSFSFALPRPFLGAPLHLYYLFAICTFGKNTRGAIWN